jgi:hypothetical protein
MENFWWRLSEMISEQQTCSQVTADSKRKKRNGLGRLKEREI